MKTARITLLGSPEFKAYLAEEAEKEGISVSELVRRRCERRPSEEETALLALTEALQTAVSEAKQSLAEGLLAASDVLAEMKAAHKEAA